MVEQQNLVESGDADDEEFEWQSTGQDKKPPAPKRMLCFTLRRLFRVRTNAAFENLQEKAELFQGAWCDLDLKGQDAFMTDITAVDLKKEDQKQMVRKVLLQMQFRYGQESLKNAFCVWKENTVLQQRVQRIKDITASM